MNNHHPLCYNDEWIDPECQLCQVIRYTIGQMIPSCSCDHDFEPYAVHMIFCKQGAFFYSQPTEVLR